MKPLGPRPRRIPASRPLRLLAMLLILTPMAACTTLTTSTPTVVDTSCSAFRIITYHSKQDALDTISQIKANNRVLRALCPAAPK